MPRTESKQVINRFEGGLVSDFTVLNFPANSTSDEANVLLNRDGSRSRRLALSRENNDTLSTGTADTTLPTLWLQQYRWENVANLGNLDFIINQIGSTLHFYDASQSNLSGSKKSFTVNLETFKAPAATTTAQTPVAVSSGKGALFVTGETVSPFFIEYNLAGDSISTTTISVEIRDFDEQDPDFSTESSPSAASLTSARRYDLLNQGWGHTGVQLADFNTGEGAGLTVLQNFFNARNVYPSKNKPWHAGREIQLHGNGQVQFTYINTRLWLGAWAGNTRAPLGHFIYDAFNIDRNTADGVSGLTVEQKDERPSAIAFFSSRVFYALENTLYFSQLIKDNLNIAGRCYQDADPTAEDISSLVATDGGQILIPEAGKILKLFVVKSGLIIFADNGVWSIQSPIGEGFKATEFIISRISSIGASSARAIIDVQGLPVWWNEHAINALTPDQSGTSFDIVDLTENKLSTFFKAISPVAKELVAAAYDDVDEQITWLYRSTDHTGTTDRFKYDRALIYDLTRRAFIQHTMNVSNASNPYVVGVENSTSIGTLTVQEDVTNSSGALVLTSGFAVVTAGTGSTTVVGENTKFWTIVPDAATPTKFDQTFSLFQSNTFLDWGNIDYSAYMETFYHLNDDVMFYMQAPYIWGYVAPTTTINVTGDVNPSLLGVTHTVAGGTTGFVLNTAASEIAGGASSITTELHNNLLIEGEDGELYYVVDNTSGGNNILGEVRKLSDESTVWSRTLTEFDNDATNNGFDPTNTLTYNQNVGVAALPGTPFFLAWAWSTANPTRIAVIYYKITSGGTVVAHGGFSETQTSLSIFVPNLQSRVHTVARYGLGRDEDPILICAHDVEVAGNNPVLCVWPSTDSLDGLFTLTHTGNPYDDRFVNLTSTHGNFYFDHNSSQLAPNHQHPFILPKGTNAATANSYMYMYVSKADVQEHINDAAALDNNSLISAQTGTYPNGFIFRSEITISGAGTSVTAPVVANSDFVDSNGTTLIPFSNEGLNSDGTTGVDNDSYRNPSVQKLRNSGSANGGWMLWWPKLYVGQTPDLEAGDGSYMRVDTWVWDPSTEKAERKTDNNFAYFDPVADMSVLEINRYNSAPRQAALWLAETTGRLYVMTTFSASDSVGSTYIISNAGDVTFNVSSSGGSTQNPSGSAVTLQNEGGLLLQARWDWANSTRANKYSTQTQLYRYRQPIFVDVADTTIDSGYPVIVTRNKIRGKGRALQLRFDSETGKDFKLLGWGIAYSKNQRY